MGIKERERRVEVFFYGLFMDEELLRGKGLEPDSCAVVSSASGRKTGFPEPWYQQDPSHDEPRQLYEMPTIKTSCFEVGVSPGPPRSAIRFSVAVVRRTIHSGELPPG
jgi:hypothetical protein